MNISDNDLLLRRRRRFLLQLLGGSSGLLLPQLAWAGRTVQAVRSSASQTHTRFVLDLDGPVDHRVFTLEGPDRVVLDLTGVSLANASTGRVPNGSVVRSVRFGIRNGHDLRVVFDVTGKVSPRVLLLPPGEGAGHRLVVDLPHAEAPRLARSEPDEPQAAESTFRDLVIAIDAGHGGKDPGAVGPGGTYEKDIVLQISRRLRDMLSRERGLKPVMIRDSDTFITLRRRTEIAREQKADLFVSIHADAFHRQSARGASVYCLSLRGASSEAARWLARRENAADFVGGASIAHQDEVVASVLLDLAQSRTLESSMDLGDRVLRSLGGVAHLHKSEVQQANFAVLRSPDIPSILVESAFISNPTEERRLRTADYQESVARSVLKGIHSYYADRAPSGTRYAMA